MRTEEDLREALDHLASTAPATVELRTIKPVRRRRTALVVGTALVTATAAIAAPIAISHLDQQPGVAGQEKRNTTWSPWLDLPVPKGMRLNVQTYSASRQDYELIGYSGSPWVTHCLLTVHRNGDFDPAKIPGSSPRVDINGHQGRVVSAPKSKPFTPAPRGYLGAPAADVMKTVAWQPGAGLWALLTCESQLELGTRKVPNITAPYRANDTLATTIARSISPGTRNLGSPFRISYLPDGVRPGWISYAGAAGAVRGSGENFNLFLSDGNHATGYKPPKLDPRLENSNPAWTPQLGDDLEISYNTSKFWDQLSQHMGPKPDLVINGLKAWYVPDAVVGGPSALGPNPKTTKTAIRMEGNGVAVIVHSLGGETLKLDQLRKIAEGLQLTKSPKNPDAWFDAAVAIP